MCEGYDHSRKASKVYDSSNDEKTGVQSNPYTPEKPADNACKNERKSDSVIEFAKDTMNSLLGMYGYDASITKECLVAIKSEPLSPVKAIKKANIEPEVAGDITPKVNILEENLLNVRDVIACSSSQPALGRPMFLAASASVPKTATVQPLRCGSPAETRIAETPDSSGAVSLDHQSKSPPAVPGLPQKPVTPYMRYRNMLWEELKHEYPGCTPYDLACFISGKWSMLTDAERKVWEDEYEREMKEYNLAMKSFYANPALMRDFMKERRSSESGATHVKLSRSGVDDCRLTLSRSGLCSWCKRSATLQDFTSTIDGREIYCSGLCSEKCFLEAAKQICNVENGSSKPRYVGPLPRPATVVRLPVRDELKASSAVAGVLNASNCNLSSQSSSCLPLIARSGSLSSSRSVSEVSVFDWAQYLLDTGGTAAPWMYFKQSRFAPPNSFAVGMKLEIRDPRADAAFCVATVAQVIGCRLRVCLDGTDDGGVWRMPDSEDIHPVGWCEGNGGKLQLPVGFHGDVTKCSDFFSKCLRNAEMAPPKFFRKEPLCPKENYFAVGMKLEAVDKQNPSVIGVASVADVDGDRVFIEFDGAKCLAYWTVFHDRDLFPAGWCGYTSHPLQPPGNGACESLQYSRRTCEGPPSGADAFGELAMDLVRSTAPVASSSSQQLPSSSLSCVREGSVNQKLLAMSPSNNVDVWLQVNCDTGPYLDVKKLAALPRFYRGNMISVLQNVLEGVIKCAIDPKTVLGFLKPGRGNCVVTAVCDRVTYKCCLSHIDRVSAFWNIVEQFADNLRCCPNLFSNSELIANCSSCGRLSGSALSSNETSTAHQTPSSKGLGTGHSAPGTSACTVLHTVSSARTSDTQPHAAVQAPESLSGPPAKKPKQQNAYAISTSPKSWSVRQVVEFIEATDLREYAGKFQANEIDGKALLLLRQELIIDYMGFKLGPAVKLLELIEELKATEQQFFS